MDVISTPFVFDDLQYNVQYWFSSFSDAYNDGMIFLSLISQWIICRPYALATLHDGDDVEGQALI